MSSPEHPPTSGQRWFFVAALVLWLAWMVFLVVTAVWGAPVATGGRESAGGRVVPAGQAGQTAVIREAVRGR